MQKLIYYSTHRHPKHAKWYNVFIGFYEIRMLFIKDQYKHSKLRIIGQVKESLKNAIHVFKVLFCGKYLNGRTYIY